MLHVRVTEHPTAGWITQQLRGTFAYDAVPRYLSFDNDKKYGDIVLAVIKHMGTRRLARRAAARPNGKADERALRSSSHGPSLRV